MKNWNIYELMRMSEIRHITLILTGYMKGNYKLNVRSLQPTGQKDLSVKDTVSLADTARTNEPNSKLLRSILFLRTCAVL